MSYNYRSTFPLIAAAFHASPRATVQQVAARLGVHPQTVGAIITRMTGLSPRVWRQQEIAFTALRMLSECPTMSVKEIGATFGLTTNGLRRLLLRTHGNTPTHVRRGNTR
jgi:AraC-like DNA-binding protein